VSLNKAGTIVIYVAAVFGVLETVRVIHTPTWEWYMIDWRSWGMGMGMRKKTVMSITQSYNQEQLNPKEERKVYPRKQGRRASDHFEDNI